MTTILSTDGMARQEREGFWRQALSETFVPITVGAVPQDLDAADGKHLKIFSPSPGTPLLERGLIDEVDLHVPPRLLGDGTRQYDVADGPCASCRTWVGDDPNAATNLRFRTTYEK